jgi:hypothetical protein
VIGGLMSLFVVARLTERFGSRRVLLALMGTGMGVAIPSMIMLAMSGAEAGDAGPASGLNNTAQQGGAAVGTAVLATLAASLTAVRVGEGATMVSALRDGYSVAFLAAAGFVVAALLLAATPLRCCALPGRSRRPPAPR